MSIWTNAERLEPYCEVVRTKNEGVLKEWEQEPDTRNNMRRKIMKKYFSSVELVADLMSFDHKNEIRRYQLENLKNKNLNEIFEITFGVNICRAFPKEQPKSRFRNWSWYSKPKELTEKLSHIQNQDSYDRLIYSLGDTLVEEWNYGRNFPSRMNNGVSMKIINLLMKHITYSSHNQNPKIENFLHVPWDKFTLQPIQHIYNKKLKTMSVFNIPKMYSAHSMGFVENREIYRGLHQLISEICSKAEVPRIYYEFLAWNVQHK
jgi:hypothetical protein